MLEAMAWVTFRVTEDGVTISETNTGAIPMVCQYRKGNLRLEQVYLLENYTEELAAEHGIVYYDVTLSLEELQTWSKDVLGDWILDASAFFSNS